MTGETERNVSGWTVDTLSVHLTDLREADTRFHEERDRRYAEVAAEREKALDIEKSARAEALQLAREIQTYKDEKANELREQINNERGNYASKSDLQAAVEKIEETIKPIAAFVAGQQGRSGGQAAMWGWIVGGISVGILIINFLKPGG